MTKKSPEKKSKTREFLKDAGSVALAIGAIGLVGAVSYENIIGS